MKSCGWLNPSRTSEDDAVAIVYGPEVGIIVGGGLTEGIGVGTLVGITLGNGVVGKGDGAGVVGIGVVGKDVGIGLTEGIEVGTLVGSPVGSGVVGNDVGAGVGVIVGMQVGWSRRMAV